MLNFFRRTWYRSIGPGSIAKVVVLSVTVGYLLLTSLTNQPILAQNAVQQEVTSGELMRRIERIEETEADRRLAVMESISKETSARLDGIEGFMRSLMVAMALLLAETVWTTVLRIRKKP